MLKSICAFLIMASTAFAQPIPGSDDPDYWVAEAQWLVDDDASALPALATLAQNGNDAARILLGVIDPMVEVHADYTLNLPQDTRSALFRQPSGTSTRSWLQSVTNHAIASAHIRAAKPEYDLNVVLDLAALGEHRAARIALYSLIQRVGFEPLRDALLPVLNANSTSFLHAASITALQIQPYVDDPLTAVDLGVDVPTRVWCHAACGSEHVECQSALFRTMGLEGLMRLGSPVEALIPAASWWGSAKGRLSLVRSEDFAQRAARAQAQMPFPQCLAESLP